MGFGSKRCQHKPKAKNKMGKVKKPKKKHVNKYGKIDGKAKNLRNTSTSGMV